MNRRIPVCEPYLWGNEKKYVSDALDRGWISSAGDYLVTFEERFARYCGVEHGVAVTNGTAALHLALLAAGIRPGDEVLVNDFTMISPVLAIVQAGAIPVFVDACPVTWTMDPGLVEARITPRTRAILAVHIYGHPCDMDALDRTAKRHDLRLIEDSAEAHGATVNGRRCGGLSELGCFSFYANKIITTGEGGMVVTGDIALADYLREHRNLCFGKGARRFVHTDLGYNYRLTNLQAALGVAQLEHIAEAVHRKRAIARRYDALLADVPGVIRPAEASWAESVYWVYGIMLTPEFGMPRDALMAALDRRGIETRPFFTAMHQQPLFRRYLRAADEFPVARQLAENGLYLPSYMHMGDDVIEQVAGAIRDVRKQP